MLNLFVVLASMAIGAIAWTGVHGPMWLLCLLPILWHWADRRARAVSVLSYSAVGLWPVVASIEVFFPAWPSYAGVAVWACFVGVWTLPWIMFGEGRTTLMRLVTASSALAITFLPPLGILAWCHPLLSAGWLAPGGGWLACLLLILVWSASAALKSKLVSGLTAVGLVVLGACQLHGVELLLASKQLGLPVGIDTVGKVPDSPAALAERMGSIADQIAQLPDDGSPAFLPEAAISNWGPSSKALVDLLVSDLSSRRPIVLGTVFEESEKFAGAVIVHKGNVTSLRARQSLQLSLWRPWDPDAHHSSSWSQPGVYNIGGSPVAINICSEELTIFWAALVSARALNPQVVVTMANVWWMTNPQQVASQLRHGEAFAALLGVPYRRAVNWPVGELRRTVPSRLQRETREVGVGP